MPICKVRFRFYYNTNRIDLADAGNSLATNGPVSHAVLIQQVADSHPPEYPKKPIDAKVGGIVRLEGIVSAAGEISELKVVEG